MEIRLLAGSWRNRFGVQRAIAGVQAVGLAVGKEALQVKGEEENAAKGFGLGRAGEQIGLPATSGRMRYPTPRTVSTQSCPVAMRSFRRKFAI